ncbi:MAG: SLBB domain-containing protein [Alistipes sp.]|nr:SLBB domain-containing protein [Alistipes sp.]MDE7069272.1 SLBB domain-containing protein [Alistipes sp.]
MTDAAVKDYVKTGLASGKSQQDIARELAARGVTREQAERIRQAHESETSSGSDEAFRKAGEQERERRADSGLNETKPVDFDLLTSIQQQIPAANRENKPAVFGRNIFTTKNLTFAPNTQLPTPPNYRLGPGDEVIIDIWGANQASIRQTISPDGTINIPDLGLISLNGMTVSEADAYMRRMLGRIYSLDGSDAKSEIKLTLGNIRSIQVNLMGEVAVPGTYYLSSLSNIFHALYRAGGVSDLGSLRDIQLIRNGRKIASLDVYEFILKGKSPDDILLQEGDIVIVPAYETLVDLSGNVKRPMTYEMKAGETVANLLDYASGFSGDAYRNSLRMIRRNGREYRVYTIDRPDYASFELRDGDALEVGAMLDRFENRIEVKGAVYRPGIYELGSEIATVGQLLAKAEGVKGDAFTNRALLQREKEDLTLEVLPLDIAAIMAGTAEDIPLRKNDVLFVASIHDLQDIGQITVFGEVARPGQFIFAENTTLEDIIMQAGGLLESASVVKVDVSRRIKDPAATELTDTLSEIFTFSLKDGFVIDGEPNFILEPYDQIFVRRSPAYNPQENVTITGEVTFPGPYVLTSKNEKLSDLVAKAGGTSRWAYVKGARLERTMTVGEKARSQAVLDALDNSKDSINVNKLELADTYYVGIDLEAALNNPGGNADLVLRVHDRLHIPTMVNTVRITGNVMYPNVVTYDPDKKVGDFIKMAGGYGFRAKKGKAYIVYMNGTVARAKRNSKEVVQPGCEIIVPERRKSRSTLAEIMGIATTSASLATMIATIGTLAK